LKKLILMTAWIVSAMGANIIGLQYSGVIVGHADANGSRKTIKIERETDPKCIQVEISNDMIWSGSYAGSKVPKECKSVFVTSVGQIQPLKIHPDIETFGELELLDFIKKMQKNEDMLLVDSRSESWYEYLTIPSAVNIPHDTISNETNFPDEFRNALQRLGIQKKNGIYDFRDAKTIALFCNGAWCGQSPSMIKELLKLGYPAVKIKWYRGGIEDWLALSMTNTRSKDGDKR